MAGVVTDDPEDAAAAAGRGEPVVLIVPAGAAPGPIGADPGRIAVLVGDSGDATTQAAAAAMEAELYRPGPA